MPFRVYQDLDPSFLFSFISHWAPLPPNHTLSLLRKTVLYFLVLFSWSEISSLPSPIPFQMTNTNSLLNIQLRQHLLEASKVALHILSLVLLMSSVEKSVYKYFVSLIYLHVCFFQLVCDLLEGRHCISFIVHPKDSVSVPHTKRVLNKSLLNYTSQALF